MMTAQKKSFRSTAITSLLAGCAVLVLAASSAQAGSKLASRWVGKEAGTFFAAYGPPTSDVEQGSNVVYGWRGGYSSRKIAAVRDKKGKLVNSARTEKLVCQVKLTVSSKYVIKKIEALVDKPGRDGGPTWCEQYLDAAN